MKHSERWKDLERATAAALGGRRIVEHWTLFQERPDVLVDDFRLVCDCKAHSRFAHHTLVESVQRKYCQPGDVPVLVTKSAGQHGAYVTVPLGFLAGLLNQARNTTAAAAAKENELMATKPKFDPAMFAAVKADAAKAEAKRQAAAPKPPRVPVLTPKPPKAVVVPPVAVKPVTAILPLTPTLARQELTAIFVAARCTRRGAEELVARMTDRQAMKLAADARKAKTHA